ncbi:ABC transporter permease [uncultured Alsobacter sp.]|uniref:ABC transporter permease n=1 Tax=uncultured Alsobacter sp. TaxID=1748258 RepID=UPI0025F3772B|nr:ABC transporter permease [uncultured Alsobacter sp.]
MAKSSKASDRQGAAATWLLVAPALAIVAGLLVAPVANTATMPLTSGRAVALYQRFFTGAFNQAVTLRTLEIAAVTTVVSLVLGFVAAYVVARAPQKARSILIVAAVFPLLTGTVVRSFAFMVILGRNGLANDFLQKVGLASAPLQMLYTEFAVIVGLVYLFTPLMIVSLVGVLENIDPDLSRAAASLGATPGAVFRQVILPLAVPGLIVGSVLVFTGSFTAFATPQLLGGEQQTVLATLLYQKAMVSFDWMGAATIATVMVVITLLVVVAMTMLARRLNPATG